MPDIRMMDDMMAFTAVIMGIACFTGIVITWLKRRPRPLGLATAELLDRLDAISERLARVDVSVDTMAVEVERISEAQRFTARVLAEHAVTPVLPSQTRSAGPTATPH